MNVAQKSMTVEEFLVWAETRPEKHWELFDGVARMQQSQTWGHARQKYLVARAFEDAIAASGLSLSFGVDGIVVKAGPKLGFEPDVVVFSGVMNKRDILTPDPIIVVEVLSPSTARKDLTVKLAGYFQIPTVQHYLIVDWEEPEVIHYRRLGEGLAPPEMQREGALRLEPPGLTLDLGAVFK